MENKKEKRTAQSQLLISIALAVVGLAGMLVSNYVLTPKYKELQGKIVAVSSIVRNVTAVENQKYNYEMILEESGKEYENILENKDLYIAYLGEITMANKLGINKMTVDDIKKNDDQIYSMRVQIELRGDLYNIKNLVQQLYDSATVSRINSFSYRLQNNHNLMWMWREIDDETLIPWWEMVETNNGSGSAEGQEPICVDDLLAHGEALCYLEIEFLGLGR